MRINNILSDAKKKLTLMQKKVDGDVKEIGIVQMNKYASRGHIP